MSDMVAERERDNATTAPRRDWSHRGAGDWDRAREQVRMRGANWTARDEAALRPLPRTHPVNEAWTRWEAAPTRGFAHRALDWWDNLPSRIQTRILVAAGGLGAVSFVWAFLNL